MILIGYVSLFLTFAINLNRQDYMTKTVSDTPGPHYDKVKLSAFCTAIDEGDASPDVEGFDEERFVREMKEGRVIDKNFCKS